MKKAIALTILIAFVATLAGLAYGRTLEEERDAVRAYLTVIDAKIIKYRKAGNVSKMKVLQAEKAGTLKRWAKLKAQMEMQEIAPPVAVPPPPPPPVVMKPVSAPEAGMFGWGLKTSADVGYITGGKTASILAGGSIVLSDPLAMGSWVGLPADAVSYKVGLGLTYGKDMNDATFNAILLTGDGVLNLADWMGGMPIYAGAQVNYPVYKSDITGQIGALIYGGLKGDIGLGGMSYAELGYGAIRRTGASTKGIDIKVGQEIVL